MTWAVVLFGGAVGGVLGGLSLSALIEQYGVLRGVIGVPVCGLVVWAVQDIAETWAAA